LIKQNQTSKGKELAIGENLRRLRRDKRWTQGQLAKATGLRVNQISRIEQNKSDTRLTSVYKIMEALGCSPNALIDDVSDMILDRRWQIMLERIQNLPDREKNTLLEIVDKYCLAISMQGLLGDHSSNLLGLGLTRVAPATEELSMKQSPHGDSV